MPNTVQISLIAVINVPNRRLILGIPKIVAPIPIMLTNILYAESKTAYAHLRVPLITKQILILIKNKSREITL